MVDSPAAAGAKGSSPLEDRKSFRMVLLEVRILPHTPSLFRYSVEDERVVLSK